MLGRETCFTKIYCIHQILQRHCAWIHYESLNEQNNSKHIKTALFKNSDKPIINKYTPQWNTALSLILRLTKILQIGKLDFNIFNKRHVKIVSSEKESFKYNCLSCNNTTDLLTSFFGLAELFHPLKKQKQATVKLQA